MRFRRSLLLVAVAAPAVGAQSRATLIGAVGDTRAITDTAGRFTVIGLPAGSTSVTVRRLGFAPTITRILLADGRIDSIHFTLVLLPAYLPSLVADAEAGDRIRLADFYRHRETGLGFYFNRRQIDSIRVSQMSDLMRRIPGIRMMSDRSGRPQLRMSRSGNCPPDFWIDGQRAPYLNVDDVPLWDVEALEVYRGPTGLPPEYNVRFGNPGCGAVIIWTRLR
jgi:hypothetical protein